MDFKKYFEDTKGVIRNVNRRRTDNTMVINDSLLIQIIVTLVSNLQYHP
jgi:hypothetical protein